MANNPLLSFRALGQIGVMGGLGGAINAALCYFKLPVSIPMHVTPPSQAIDFPWHVIPAGAAHGALLALGSVGCARLVWNQRLKLKGVGLLLVTWVVGWVSCIPIRLSVFRENVHDALTWPLASGFANVLDVVRGPITSFGLVAGFYYLLLALCRQLTARSLRQHVIMGVLSGVAGSFYWWASFGRWYFSLLHGAIWGALVGYSVWTAQRGTQDSPRAERTRCEAGPGTQGTA